MNLKNFSVFFCFIFFILIVVKSVAQAPQGIVDIPIPVQQQMINKSWYQGCPIALQQLAYVTVPYWGFDQKPHKGVLIVNKKIASDVLTIFQEIYAAKFPIAKIHPMYLYNGDDDHSMVDNNTSAFNCRSMADSPGLWSLHSYGVAIDINPLLNPYLHQKVLLPPKARPYLNRDASIPGMINKNTVVYQSFIHHGWSWGGDWQYTKDYGHFEKPD